MMPKKQSSEGSDVELEMGAGLSLSEWLSAIRDSKRARSLISYEFPTDKLRDEFLRHIESRSDEDVRFLLRRFLISSGSLGSDRLMLAFLVDRAKAAGSFAIKTEFERRLFTAFKTKGATGTWEGLTWILDLLPSAPRKALDVLDAYLETHAALMPDGRLGGMGDARAIIRAKYILTGDIAGSEAALDKLTDRELEVLVAALYRAMGYSTRLTPPTKDGGRDVIAKKKGAARREVCLVECKHHGKPVGVKDARALLFVVSDERATKGVLVSTSRFTAGTRKLAKRHKRLDLIQRRSLVRLLNEHLGPSWPLKVDRLVAEDAKHPTATMP